MASATGWDPIGNHVQLRKVTGPGPPCLKCGEKCPGLDVNYWRKVCRYCRCPREDHHVDERGEQEIKRLSTLFESTATNGRTDLSLRLCGLVLDDPNTHSDSSSSISVDDDIVIARLVAENAKSQQYISMLPKEKQLFAAQLRRRQLQRQLPPHDLDPRFCASLSEKELQKFQKFVDKRRRKAAGIGQVAELQEVGNSVCQRCGRRMSGGEVAIYALKMGASSVWHPGCFTCATCKELLLDNIYFSKGGDIHCGRHYADLIYPRCSACDEIIFAKEYTQAENQTWHIQHFCCWYCDGALAGKRYIAQYDNPYCISCYDRLFGKVCSTCQRTITADSPGLTHGDYHWHACPHCFSCCTCGRNLINRQFLLKDGLLFCTVECKQTKQGYSNTSYVRQGNRVL